MPSTAGLACYTRHNILGVRGEAAAGFCSARRFGVPVLRRWIDQGFSLNDAAAATLLNLIANVEDTNMIKRGGRQKATMRQKEAALIFENLTPENLQKQLTDLDDSYILDNLSPGGSADLLAVSLMLYNLKR